jgi:flagellar protein FliL
MSEAAAQNPSVKESSWRGSLIEFVIVICLAASAGGVFEMWRPAASPAAKQPGEPQVSAPAQSSTIIDLPPIVTNLGAPPDTWIRLEGSIIFDPKSLSHPEAVAGQIGDDVLAYLRTVSLHQLEGPVGLENIRQDLSERAATRSGGKVRGFVIRTLVVQ